MQRLYGVKYNIAYTISIRRGPPPPSYLKLFTIPGIHEGGRYNQREIERLEIRCVPDFERTPAATVPIKYCSNAVAIGWRDGWLGKLVDWLG
jgi:hypothetical protein